MYFTDSAGGEIYLFCFLFEFLRNSSRVPVLFLKKDCLRGVERLKKDCLCGVEPTSPYSHRLHIRRICATLLATLLSELREPARKRVGYDVFVASQGGEELFPCSHQCSC